MQPRYLPYSPHSALLLCPPYTRLICTALLDGDMLPPLPPHRHPVIFLSGRCEEWEAKGCVPTRCAVGVCGGCHGGGSRRCNKEAALGNAWCRKNLQSHGSGRLLSTLRCCKSLRICIWTAALWFFGLRLGWVVVWGTVFRRLGKALLRSLALG